MPTSGDRSMNPAIASSVPAAKEMSGFTTKWISDPASIARLIAMLCPAPNPRFSAATYSTDGNSFASEAASEASEALSMT